MVAISDDDMAQVPHSLEALQSTYQYTDLQTASKILFNTASVKGQTLLFFVYNANGILSLRIKIKLNPPAHTPSALIKENIIEPAEKLTWKDTPAVVN